MKLLLSMTLAGSLAFFLYLIMKPVANRYFPAKWRHHFLLINMLLFLLPYQYLKFLYGDITAGLFGFIAQPRIKMTEPTILNSDNTIFFKTDGSIYSKDMKLYLFVLLLWFICVSCIVFWQVMKYLLSRKYLLQISQDMPEESLALLEQSRKLLKIRKKKIRLLRCSEIPSPFTIGVFSPCIILPDDLRSLEKQRMVLLHELVHIKNHDIPLKFLALFIILLHWYNPLAYVLFRELCDASESFCDETVVELMGRKQLIDYGTLIIEMAGKPSNISILFADSFNNNVKRMKGRIEFMKKKPIAPKYIRIVSTVTAGILLLIAPISVKAYEPASTSKGYLTDTIYANLDTEVFVSDELADSYNFNDYIDPSIGLDFEHYQEIFVDEEGNIHPLLSDNNSMVRAVCSHSYVSGQTYNHERNGSGCKLITYSAKICTKCGNQIKGDVISNNSYSPCPH